MRLLSTVSFKVAFRISLVNPLLRGKLLDDAGRNSAVRNCAEMRKQNYPQVPRLVVGCLVKAFPALRISARFRGLASTNFAPG